MQIFHKYMYCFCSVINVCLAWWVKDPCSYNQWRKTVQVLPSDKTLQRYKNCLQQHPGFNPCLLTWMQQEAERRQLQEHQRVGGIVLDEMSVQEDLTVIHKGMQTYYAGQVVTTDLCQALVNDRKGMVSWHMIYSGTCFGGPLR
jgi:hypothetical protein